MNAAGSDHIQITDFSQLARGVNIQATAQTIPADICKDNGTQAQGPHVKRQIRCSNTAVILPTTHAHQSIPRVNTTSNLLRAKTSQHIGDQIWLFNSDRAKHNTTHAQIERALNCRERTQPTTELYARAKTFCHIQN